MSTFLDTPPYLPENYDRMTVVSSREQILKAQFNEVVNLCVYPRTLTGDFNGLATKIAQYIGLPENGVKKRPSQEVPDIISNLLLTQEEQEASKILIKDLISFSQILRIERPSWNDSGVRKWHHDTTVDPKERYVCAYNLEGTEFLRNEDTLPIRNQGHKKTEYHEQLAGSDIYQFACGDIAKFEWATNDEDDWFIHRRPEIKNTAIPRLYAY